MSLMTRMSRLARSLRLKRRSIVSAAESLRQMQRLDSQTCLEAWLNRHVVNNPLLRYGRKQFSQNDEDGLVEEILRRVHGAHVTGSFLELGVGDGTENNTLNLLALGWRGAWLGGEPLRFATPAPRLAFRQSWIDRDNVASLAREVLGQQGVANADVISLDLDGNDLHICRALLTAGFRPSLWIVEYNARLGPDAVWEMPYDPAHRWDGSDYFGASLKAFRNVLEAQGYSLVACNLTGANAFFVNAEARQRFPEVPSDPSRLYMPPGYLPYPWFGHPTSLRTVETIVQGA